MSDRTKLGLSLEMDGTAYPPGRAARLLCGGPVVGAAKPRQQGMVARPGRVTLVRGAVPVLGRAPTHGEPSPPAAGLSSAASASASASGLEVSCVNPMPNYFIDAIKADK